MADFDLILLGNTGFTRELRHEFDGKVKLLFVDNDTFNGNFSSDIFPEITFIPQTRQKEGLFGQVTSDNFRFDLSTEKDIFNLMWTEELREAPELLDNFEKAAAYELNAMNFLLIENYGDNFFSLLTKEFNFIIKNFKQFVSFYFHTFPDGKGEFKSFLAALKLFFAPGECNKSYFDKYLLYSIVSKRLYKIEDEVVSPNQNNQKNSFGLLKAITQGENWELRFEKQKITGRTLVSGLPPHLLTMLDVSHPFHTFYSKAFFCLTPDEFVEPPSAMAEELVYLDEDSFCFIKNSKKEGLRFFVPAAISEKIDDDRLTGVFKTLFPHVKSLPSFTISPHIYPFYDVYHKNKVIEGKNLYFLKNFEYPFLGIDGEMLYRKRLKEILWKKLL